MDHVSENYRQDAYRGLTTPARQLPLLFPVDAQRGDGELAVHGLVGLVEGREDS